MNQSGRKYRLPDRTFGTENAIQLARFRAVALAEDTLLCKVKQRRSRWSSANPETNVTNDLRAEAFLESKERALPLEPF